LLCALRWNVQRNPHLARVLTSGRKPSMPTPATAASLVASSLSELRVRGRLLSSMASPASDSRSIRSNLLSPHSFASTDLAHSPATCFVGTLRRFQTFVVAIQISSEGMRSRHSAASPASKLLLEPDRNDHSAGSRLRMKASFGNLIEPLSNPRASVIAPGCRIARNPAKG
jgi:hypothetical protein